VGRAAQLGGLLVLAAFLALPAAACGGDGPSGDRPLVVATHSLLGDLATNVFGDQAEVELVIPAGTDPHEFEPSAAQVAMLSEADLVLANGLEFEAGLTDALDAAAGDGVPVLELGPALDPRPLEDGDGEDPHWFTDPLRMARAAGLVATAAEDLDGLDPVVVADQAADHAAAIEAADAEIAADLDAVPADQRQLVTNHEVFGYFADRYGFEIVGTLIPSGTTLAEPSASELADLVAVIEETGVPAIFADTSSSADLAHVLAEETGEDIAVVELFSESLGEEGSGGETYVELIRTNADRIVGALA
jgi:zinc/manganese transport system substrate-binding protein